MKAFGWVAGSILIATSALAQLPSDIELTTVIDSNAGLNSPVVVRAPPDGSGRLFVAENGGTIKVLDFTYDGYNAGDTLVEFDFGTIGDNQIQRRYAGKSWLNYTAAEYLGGGQYRIPFLFAGQDIFSFD